VRRRTEVVVIPVLMGYIRSPVLPHTFDLEDGLPVTDLIVIDTLRSKFTNGGGVEN
jgi:hypothetical protein